MGTGEGTTGMVTGTVEQEKSKKGGREQGMLGVGSYAVWWLVGILGVWG